MAIDPGGRKGEGGREREGWREKDGEGIEREVGETQEKGVRSTTIHVSTHETHHHNI